MRQVDDEDDDSDSFDEPESEDAPDVDAAETLPCPKCGTDIHEESQQCPRCGSYVSMAKQQERIPLWLIIGAAVCILLVLITWIARA